MECIMCLCPPEINFVKCKNYGCELITCAECLSIMISVCFDSINSMPMCECGCEYVSSQLRDILTKPVMNQYINLCERMNDKLLSELPYNILAGKELNLKMFETVKSKVRTDIYEALPPAIANLIVISELESKILKIKKLKLLELQKQTTLITNLSRRKCVSFVCTGRLMDQIESLECTICGLLVCKKCDAVKSNNGHICKTEDVESIQVINEIAKCPKCNVPATRGDGCIFITCPYCHTNFDSNTGAITSAGGHNNGMIQPMTNYTKLADLTTDEDFNGKILLNRIQKSKPRLIKSSKNREDCIYESRYNLNLYKKTINRIYELRDRNLLSHETLVNIAKYVETL